jgi:hypothetical protein
MYTRSKLTNKIYFNNVEVPQDDTHPMWQAWFVHVENEGEITEVESTPEEIAELNKPIVPATISAMRLKLQLFDLGITDEDIFEDIDSIPDFMFSVADKEKAKIKYKTATSFERTNGELNFVATMEGLTQEQVDEIFINGNL